MALTTTAAKTIIRTVLTTKGRDGFMDEEDIRNALTDHLDVDEGELEPEDIQLVQDTLRRATLTVTFSNTPVRR